MTELTRVQDAEVVDGGPSWEEIVSEWSAGAHRVLEGQLRQARAAAAVSRYYGESSMEAFAKEVGASRSTVYDYARVFWVFGHLYFDEEGSPSGRLENPGTTTITRLVDATYAPDPAQALERAEAEDLSGREQKAARKAEQEPERVHLITHIVCPACSVASPMNECETREVEA